MTKALEETDINSEYPRDAANENNNVYRRQQTHQRKTTNTGEWEFGKLDKNNNSRSSSSSNKTVG